jgi:hypothetical protein
MTINFRMFAIGEVSKRYRTVYDILGQAVIYRAWCTNCTNLSLSLGMMVGTEFELMFQVGAVSD